MRRADVYVHGILAGVLEEVVYKKHYRFSYNAGYGGPPISHSLPCNVPDYEFEGFPPFFDGLLPEGMMLEALLRTMKIDKDDLFSQLIAVGQDMVGAVTVRGAE